MVQLGKLKWPFNGFLVAMVTRKMFSWKITLKLLFKFLAQCQHSECFPQNFPKKLSSIGI